MELEQHLARLPVPEDGRRVVALGKTGEGKSEALLRMFASKAHGIAFNTKHDPKLNKYGVPISHDEIYDVMNNGHRGRFIWYPNDEWQDDMQERDHVFAKLLEAGGRVLYLDEFGDVCESAVRFPRKLRACVTRGRWKGLGVWGTTQEPMRVPGFLFSQADYALCFHLGGVSEHEELAEKRLFEKAELPWESMPRDSHRFMLKTPRTISGPHRLDLTM